MLEYRNNIVRIDNGNMPKFPVRFSNEIYLSHGTSPKNPSPVSYASSFALKCVIAGNERYLVDGKLENLSAGSILFIEPESKVEFLHSEGAATSIFLKEEILRKSLFMLSMGDKILDYPFDEPHMENIPFYRIKSYRNTKELKKIVSKVINAPEILDLDFYMELAEDVIIAQNEHFLKKNNLDFKKKSTRLEIFRRLSLVREYLEDNLSESVHLDEMAAIACLSKYHLVRTFKKIYGKSPRQYHLDLRITAIHKLLTSKLEFESINQLVACFGFNEYSVFYKHYVNRYGQKPSGSMPKS